MRIQRHRRIDRCEGDGDAEQPKPNHRKNRQWSTTSFGAKRERAKSKPDNQIGEAATNRE